MGRFIKRVLVFVLLVMIFPLYILGYNVYYDPFGVVRGDMEHQYTEPNQRFLKAKHLINNPNKYDAYIFGSSRAGKIDPRNIKTDDHWYNLSYTEGVPGDHLEDLELLINHKVEISKIVIGLDDVSYLVDPQYHNEQSLRKAYKNWHDPYFSYLFLEPNKELLATISKIKEEEQHVYYDIYEWGMPLSTFKDQWATKNPDQYRKGEQFLKPYTSRYYKNRADKTLDEIAQIISLCKQENIELTFFINPMHVVTYLNQNMDDYYYFLENLVKLTPFYDFSGINSITTDNFYYYETSHFRPLVGDKMIDKMFDQNEVGFGQWITSENIEQLIETKKKDIEIYKSLNSNK